MTENNKEVNLNSYNENAIQVLEGLEAVRKRPGMYIGSTDVRGLHHLVWEIVDNSVDEALSGFGDTIEVSINSGKKNPDVPFDNDYITVRDYGRGVPTGQHATGKSTPEVIFTVLHAGGKFGQGGYKSSGGLHGVGSSVVNALSSYMSVRIWRDGQEHLIEFEKGGHVKTPLKTLGKSSEKTGTLVTFQPDGEIFATLGYKYDTILERLRETAFLMKGMKIILTDKRKEEPKVEVLHYDNGIADYITYLNEKEKVVTPVQFFEGLDEETGIEFDLALQWNDTDSDHITSFVNNVRTPDGGSHETGFKSAISKAVNEVAKEKNMMKKNKKLESKDILSGLVGIVSVRVPEEILQFVGQTKAKLGTAEARGSVEKFLYEKMKHYLIENNQVSETLIHKAIRALEMREALKKTKEMLKNGTKGKKKNTISDKIAPATKANKKKNELYLVEGDSAGGSAKQGREKSYQGILPLRGKVLNVHDESVEKALSNVELSTLVYALGAGIGNDFEEKDLNYDKVIIMTDADTDGSHIQCLLLTFFIKFMPDLIKGGHLYIAKPPLFKVTIKDKKKIQEYGTDHAYFWDKVAQKEFIKDLKLVEGMYMIQRYKGLGEMNAEQLFETTMNPDNRILIQVSIANLKQTLDTLYKTMGKDSSVRKVWIEENVDFDEE